MRLINTSTLVLEEFTGTEVPAYAILSHTWEPNQEVSLQEWHPFLRRLPLSRPRKKKGYAKILAACREARKQKLDYLWCDTNCINKSSSSELTEAINSMFSWYRGSSVCFVYLADVSCPLDKGLEPGGDFERSRWFTRGWTLQELLAPNEVLFYSANWELLGDKYDLRERISAITLIDEYYVQFSAVSSANTARKMSWVSRRVTTRLEDLAYCMLGILGVNMPLLYGEGSRAFVRLQEEIIRQTNDHTIFCWSLDRDSQGHYIDMSIPTILAPHPIAFSESNTIWETAKESWPASLYSIANAGLHIQLPLLPVGGRFCGVLDVTNYALSYGMLSQDVRMCIALEGSLDSGIFFRASFPEKPIMLSKSWVSTTCTRDVYFPPLRRQTALIGPVATNEVERSPPSFDYGALLIFDDLLNQHRAGLRIGNIDLIEASKDPSMIESSRVLFRSNSFGKSYYDDHSGVLALSATVTDNVYGAILLTSLEGVAANHVIFLATLDDTRVKPKSETWAAQVILASELQDRPSYNMAILWEAFKSRLLRHEFGVDHGPETTVTVELGWTQTTKRIKKFKPIRIRIRSSEPSNLKEIN